MALAFWRTRGASPDATHGRLRQSPTVLATAQGEELVLLDLQGERYYTLNAVGSRVWTLLADGATRAEIVAAIRQEYDMPAGREGDPIEGDVTRLLARLLEAGLVVGGEVPAPELP